MPHKGSILEQANKISIEKAEFTCVGRYDTMAMVQSGTTVTTCNRQCL